MGIRIFTKTIYYLGLGLGLTISFQASAGELWKENQFYLINQTEHDYITPGPWVPGVQARVGVDTNNDGKIDEFTPWQEIKRTMVIKKGFSQVINVTPAKIDLTPLPSGFAFSFEFKINAKDSTKVLPIMDSVKLSFQRAN